MTEIETLCLQLDLQRELAEEMRDEAAFYLHKFRMISNQLYKCEKQNRLYARCLKNLGVKL